MAYADFQLETAEAAFGLTSQLDVLFGDLDPLPIPGWLDESLARGREAGALVSEKSRSEFIVVPILLAARNYTQNPLSIFSGQRLDVDQRLGLIGECDFILARTPPIPRLKAPIVTILEAKKNDVESGLGQCVAQMVGARLFNEKAGLEPGPMFGCVTSGQVWQFLRLNGAEVTIDRDPIYLDNLGAILAAFRSILADAPSK